MHLKTKDFLIVHFSMQIWYISPNFWPIDILWRRVSVSPRLLEVMLNSDLASQEQASESISSNRASHTERRSKILFPNQSSSSARSPSHQHSLTLEIKELNGWWLGSSRLWRGCFFCLLLNAFMITDGLICQKWAFCWSLKCSKSYCCTFLQGFPHYVSKSTLHNFQQIRTKHYFSFLLYSPR